MPPSTFGKSLYGDTFCRHDGGIDHESVRVLAETIKIPIILDLETIHITLQNNGTTVNKQSCFTNLSG